MGSVEETRLLELTLSTEQLLDNYVPENVREAVYALYAAHITGGLRALMLTTLPHIHEAVRPFFEDLSWMHSEDATSREIVDRDNKLSERMYCVVAEWLRCAVREHLSDVIMYKDKPKKLYRFCDDVPVTTQRDMQRFGSDGDVWFIPRGSNKFTPEQIKSIQRTFTALSKYQGLEVERKTVGNLAHPSAWGYYPPPADTHCAPTWESHVADVYQVWPAHTLGSPQDPRPQLFANLRKAYYDVG